jgi:glycosyltransferase involved in cell wall biosynthesis
MSDRIPLVSVVIPVRNGMPFLKDAVRSIVQQSFSPIEIIVVDDGSTDGSAEWLRSCSYRNVKLISREGVGACAARNAGLAASAGQLIQFVDADDLLHPNKIDLQVRQHLVTPDPDTFVSFSQLIQFRDGCKVDQGEIWHDEARIFDRPLLLLAEILDSGRFIQTGQWLIPRKLAMIAGTWDEELQADQDGDYFSRVLACAKKCVACPEAIAYYRRMTTGSQISAGKSKQHFASRLIALERKLKLIRPLTDDELFGRVVDRQCSQLAFSSYPCNTVVAKRCLELLKQHAIDFHPQFPTRQLRWVSNILGWRVARYCSYLKHRGQG